MAVTEPHQLYVRAAHARDQGGGITGGVLHLATWVHDRPGTVLPLGTGSYQPVCGGKGPRLVERWDPTGPWAHRWAGHAHWPLCRYCERTLNRLLQVAALQVLRHEAGPLNVVPSRLGGTDG